MKVAIMQLILRKNQPHVPIPRGLFLQKKKKKILLGPPFRVVFNLAGVTDPSSSYFKTQVVDHCAVTI